VEMEQTLLDRASDFTAGKETANSLLMISEALYKYERKNETFWKVFGNILSRSKHELTEP
jgi:hypothetical protein